MKEKEKQLYDQVTKNSNSDYIMGTSMHCNITLRTQYLFNIDIYIFLFLIHILLFTPAKKVLNQQVQNQTNKNYRQFKGGDVRRTWE